MCRLTIFMACFVLCGSWVRFGEACNLEPEKIAEIMGVKATTTPDGVVRVGWPRNDVAVEVDGLAMRPFMGLGTWAAFQQDGKMSMVMGDTVCFEDEVNPAIDAAFEHGLEVTALHNHFFFDEPKVYFMHIGGTGCPDELAKGVRAVWDAVKEVRAAAPQPARKFPGDSPSYGKLATDRLAEIVGAEGTLEDEVFKITIGRAAEMNETKFGGSMGLTTWAAFAGTDDAAVVDGDFAMTGNEVQPVLKALRQEGINIVALHNHMLGEEPAIYFTHFWGKGTAEKLAQGIRHALDAQAAAPTGVTAVAPKSATTRQFAFEGDRRGELPAGFSEALTGGGGPVQWQVIAANDAPSGKQAVAQLSKDRTSARYPLLVLDEFTAKDVDVSVRFQPVSGQVDQAAGIVWRWQDKDNYFIARANALEDNVVAYKTVNGVRSSIGVKGDAQSYGVKTSVPPGEWSTLRVRMVGNTAEVFLNDEKVLEVENDTFPGVGRIGLWTKADSVTYFDDLTVTSLDAQDPTR
jgi:hypothetical protein